MTDQRSSGVALQDLPDTSRTAWTRLRDELRAILGDDLAAMWAHGGTVALDGPPRAADLDTCVILIRRPDPSTVKRIEAAHEGIARDLGVDWDAWYVLADDARRPDSPPHAFHPERRDTSWAIERAHWLAGRFVALHGQNPAEIVPVPTSAEITADLQRELEHLARHVVARDTDPYEATYAILNGSRILHAIETGSPVLSKAAAGRWALAHLPARWHPALHAATSAYAGEATAEGLALIATEMAPFVAMVTERMPAVPEARLVDNRIEHHYELWDGDDRVATIDYRTLPEAIVLIHTETEEAFEGKGFGSRLVHDALADIRSRGLKVVPECPFVRSYLRRRPDEADVLAPDAGSQGAP